MTLHGIVSAVTTKKKAKLLHSVFGYKSTDNIVGSFNILDSNDSGEVTLDQFISLAHEAFSTKSKEGKVNEEYEIAEPLEVSEIPEPPPMTRELLYRAVFNEVDSSNGQKDGYITLNKLVKTINKKRNSIKEVFGIGSDIGWNNFSLF